MLGFPLEIDTRTQFLEALHIIFPAWITTARSINHFLYGQFCQVFEHILLFVAKRLYTVLADILGGCLAVNLGEGLVQVHKAPTQTLSQQPTDRSFARSHIAD